MNHTDLISSLLARLYKGNDQLLATLLTHSECVARKAVSIADRNFPVADIDFITEAAMLHDIGIIYCHAPAIGCHGDAPYICHGIIGSEILKAAGLPKHALVCERHTGSGLTAEEVVEANLPLPVRDYLPLSLEEKLICYADSFFSKSRDLRKEKSFDEVCLQMKAHGENPYQRFLELHNLLNP